MGKDDPVRFGAEFGPHRTKRASGVSLSTFKTLVWVSNLGPIPIRNWNGVDDNRLILVRNHMYSNWSSHCTLPFEL